jgi:hypothetical protein
MKKITILTACAIVMSLASCKKDRTCECTYTSTEPGSVSETNSYTILDVKKKDAKVSCISVSETYTVNGASYTDTQTCTIK